MEIANTYKLTQTTSWKFLNKIKTRNKYFRLTEFSSSKELEETFRLFKNLEGIEN